MSRDFVNMSVDYADSEWDGGGKTSRVFHKIRPSDVDNMFPMSMRRTRHTMSCGVLT